ncbi:MAG: prepilin-type N-terminal cleavage/methylation domain-containing protein [Candidatus Paceibacterota bacterium]
MIQRNFSQSGFSLVETLVAISLLLLIIVGPMVISAQTAKSSTFASEQIQAFFLAQEGLELAQKARDDLRLEEFDDIINGGGASLGDGWTDFTDSSGTYADCFSGSGCGLDWKDSVANNNELNVISCSTLSDCRLYLSTVINDRSQFTYNGALTDIKPFTRQIRFDDEDSSGNPLDTDKEIRIISTVTWRTGSLVADQKVEVESYLYAEGRN